jgi:anti-sigma regulatory factor (Ser/Thr protein kinase)
MDRGDEGFSMRDAEAQLIHDMRNTAMVIREAASQLHENLETLPPGVVVHLTEMLSRRSDMLVRLLGDLSTSHLSDRGELGVSLQPVALAEICDELLAERQPTVTTQITIQVPEDAVVIGDPVRITQVLDNLVTNAIRYGGPNVLVSATREGGHVSLTVGDDGPGVANELVGTLFDAYVHGATSRSLGGSGLGLLIVRQLCDAMGGTIQYDDSLGTRFTATFAAVPAPSGELAADVAQAGHSVTFWHTDEGLMDSVLAFVVHGLAAGEAVVVAATPSHRRLLEAELVGRGIDLGAVTASGQYITLDAEAIHNALPRGGHIDRQDFQSLVGQALDDLSSHWRSFRVFGEIVDLYWRRGDGHLALELEACWNRLRAGSPFPLLCGYELAAGESTDAVHGCHDLVVST